MSAAMKGIPSEPEVPQYPEEIGSECENHVQTFFEDAPIAYHEINRDGILTRVNQEECALLGYKESEMIGRPVWHFVSEESQMESRLAILRKINGTQPLQIFERRLRRFDGDLILVEIHESLIRRVDGMVIGIRSGLLDITARRRAEDLLRNYQQHLESEVNNQTAQLCSLNRHLVGEMAERRRFERSVQESEERYRATFENSPLGIYRTALSGEILMANPSMINMLGYHSFEELATAGLKSICDRDDFTTQIQRCGELRNFESTWRKADGSSVCIRENARLLRDDKGQPAYFEGAIEDTTERKQLEGQLRQAQKMEAVGRLAAGVAHDFNNILMVISGYCEALSHKLLDPESSSEAVNEIAKAAHRGADLTKQLLSFSRVETPHLDVVDLNRLVLDMELMLRRLIGERVVLSLSLQPDLGGIEADAGQINQVIMNLAVNGRDAMAGGGHLRIETLHAQLDENSGCSHLALKSGSYVVLTLSDTGCGMDSVTATKIFEPFFTTKEADRGTGLGLSTVYGIVKRFKGEIEVNSELGVGSTFKIYLPAVTPGLPQPNAVPAALTKLPVIQRTETILLVEDEELVRMFMKGALIRLGYQVLEAQDGQQALSISANHAGPIHLVLTDLIMPGMQGPEVVERVVAQRPETLAMFMSGYSDDVITLSGTANIPAFIRKPFTIQKLGEKLQTILGHGSPTGSQLTQSTPSV